jgi:hypothetical protein
MEDVERATDRPREEELAVATDSVVGEDAVGALPNPSLNVGAKLWPEEAKTDAM